MHKEIQTKSALHRLVKKRLPYDWDLNIYRGCRHRCQYCYALYSHKYLETDNCFFDEIFVKTNIVENLERELASKKWKGDIINMGGVTDSYQELEREYGIMRDVLRLMIKYKNPIIISTKSDLILRDIDLLSELSELTYVNIAVTVTTMDEAKRKLIEPFAVPSKRRFEVLGEFTKTKASTGLHMMPIMPFITDGEENVDEIFQLVKKYNIDYVLTGTLNLIGKTKENFLNFVRNNFPEFYNEYLYLYKDWRVKKEYNINLYKMINVYKKKYGVSGNYMKPIKDRLDGRGQMMLF